ncbi:Lysophospholipase L1 [Paenibacillus sp. UNCCL117]|uniref:SGNH/GDSL hydrolase family protein n=1 Tax=unclassified Paenibacillus TaxID=185978 RepID=UPI00088009CD|nr:MULTISPECIES: SGNH/GDSL hydrolase family protein [unclassified Paenibacillus]SDE12443.1 Lysophospholipase L1 [Paenibacillus sp. cl123]SFW60182.1 Lysophospholipase L1 [Paenibacillus sp. UNCCL117]
MINIRKWQDHPENSYRFIAFGSSNTELTWSSAGRHNWVDWLGINLREQIGRHVCIVNQGIGGETSDDLVRRLERDVLSLQPAAVIITIGGNDAVRGMPIEQYAENIRRICVALRGIEAEPVLQTYYCPLFHLFEAGFRHSFENIVQTNRALAAEMQLSLFDTYSRFEPFYRNEPETYEKLMMDRLHVNYLGNLLMGMSISAELGLPNLQIPEDIKAEADWLWGRMNRWCGK